VKLRTNQLGAASISGVLFAVVLLAIAALLFVGVYIALPGNDHFYALIWIGILALIFALGSYLGSAMTQSPSGARLATWGFLGMGFAVLLLTILVGPGNPLSVGWQIVGLVLVLLVLAGVLAFASWRGGELGRERKRVERRQEWASQPPPSAFSYAAAQKAPAPPAPASPPTTPPSKSGGSP